MPAPDIGQALAALYLNRDANLLASFGNRAGTDVTPTVSVEPIPPTGGGPVTPTAYFIQTREPWYAVAASGVFYGDDTLNAIHASAVRRGEEGELVMFDMPETGNGPAPNTKGELYKTLCTGWDRSADTGGLTTVDYEGETSGDGNPFGVYIVSTGAPVAANEDRLPWERIMAGASVAQWSVTGLPAKASAGNDTPTAPSVVFWANGAARLNWTAGAVTGSLAVTSSNAVASARLGTDTQWNTLAGSSRAFTGQFRLSGGAAGRKFVALLVYD